MAVGHPQALGAAVEERVTRAFEGHVARHERDLVAAILEPVGEVRLLVLALGIAEARGDEPVLLHQPGVGGEDHVG